MILQFCFVLQRSLPMKMVSRSCIGEYENLICVVIFKVLCTLLLQFEGFRQVGRGIEQRMQSFLAGA